MSFQPQINTDTPGHFLSRKLDLPRIQRYKRLGKQVLSTFICVHLWLFMLVSSAHAQESITVAVASSFYNEAAVLSKTFEQNHDVQVRLVSGSTGRLYNQITQGAPFDMFIAADNKRPELLLKQGKAIATHAAGQGYLGLIVHGKLVSKLAQLTNPDIQHIAIANPDIAPFGMATKKILQKQGLWKLLKSKFIYAQNALQAQMLVQKGLVDAGFVAIQKKDAALATIPYVAVLLSDSAWVRSFYQDLDTNTDIIPAKAGIYTPKKDVSLMDFRLRRNNEHQP